MLLPKPAPPVERKTNLATRTATRDVKPQMTCACRLNSDNTKTLWCIIGRSFYNTGQNC